MKRLSLILALTAVAACGDSDEGSSVTVVFPDNVKERALHCSAVLALVQLVLTKDLVDSRYEWIKKTVKEHHRENLVPALQSANAAVASTRAIDIMDKDAFGQLIVDTNASFNGDTKELLRHSDMCKDVFAPKE